jgi:hypothetical protein
MDAADHATTPTPAGTGATPRGYRAWVVAVQCLLVVGWAMYVLYLPGLLRAAGIDPRLAIAVLMLDQAIFAACDWAAGAYADRLARAAGRTGPVVTAFALASSAAMLAMPWIASLGSPALLLATIIAWTATSSALRAPVFALLGRVSGIENKSGTVGWALVSLSVAGALTPILTLGLAKLDPALPLGLGAVALALCALFASRIEARFPPLARAQDDDAARAAKRWLAAVVLLAAIGTQVHTAVQSKPEYARFAGAAADGWMPTFWIGFALALPLAVLVARGASPLARASLAMLVGAAALVLAQRAPSLGALVAAQLVAGAAWAVLATVVVSSAIALGGASRAGTAAGMVFAALAAAAVIRLALVYAGVQASAAVAWVPLVAWLAAGALLVARARAIEAMLSVVEVRSVRATPA